MSPTETVAASALYRGVTEWARCRYPLALVDGHGKPLSGIVRGEPALVEALAARPDARGVAVAAARHYGGIGWTAVDPAHVSPRHAVHLAGAFESALVVDGPSGVRFVPYVLDADRPSWVAPDPQDPCAIVSPFLALPEGALVVLPGSRDESGGEYRWTAWGARVDGARLSALRELTIAQRAALWRDTDSALPSGYRHPFTVVRALP